MSDHATKPAEGPRSTQRAQQLQEAAAAMAAALSIVEVSESFLDVSERFFGAEDGVLYTLDERGELRLMGGRGDPLPVAEVVRTGRPLWFESHTAQALVALPLVY